MRHDQRRLDQLNVTGLIIGEGQLKAKLAKLKRELLTPSGGGGGGGCKRFPISTLSGLPFNL
jgi:ribosome-interacting GTPase 1